MSHFDDKLIEIYEGLQLEAPLWSGKVESTPDAYMKLKQDRIDRLAKKNKELRDIEKFVPSAVSRRKKRGQSSKLRASEELDFDASVMKMQKDALNYYFTKMKDTRGKFVEEPDPNIVGKFLHFVIRHALRDLEKDGGIFEYGDPGVQLEREMFIQKYVKKYFLYALDKLHKEKGLKLWPAYQHHMVRSILKAAIELGIIGATAYLSQQRNSEKARATAAANRAKAEEMLKGKVVGQEIKTDKDGNPVYDDEGNVVMINIIDYGKYGNINDMSKDEIAARRRTGNYYKNKYQLEREAGYE